MSQILFTMYSSSSSSESENETNDVPVKMNDKSNENERAPVPPLVGKKFNNFDDGFLFLNSWGASTGFGFSKDGRHAKQGYVRCDRGRTFIKKTIISDEKKKRNTASRLTGCPVKFRMDLNDEDFWIIKPLILQHNHEPSTNKAAHPVHRKFSVDLKKNIRNNIKAGVNTRDIISVVRQENSDVAIIAQDVANEKKKNFAGRNWLEGVLFKL